MSHIYGCLAITLFPFLTSYTLFSSTEILKNGKISWTDKITNADLLRKVNEDKQILNALLHRNVVEWVTF